MSKTIAAVGRKRERARGEKKNSPTNCLKSFLSNFSSHNKFSNKKAFTLAEVLVTLTIIGVVSSMTIPTLHQRHTEQATVNKVKKLYTTLSQAYQKAVVEHGDVDTWGITGHTQTDALIIYDYLIKDNFKIMKDCGFNNDGGCIYNGDYKLLNGGRATSYANDTTYNYYKLGLNDGSTVWFRGDENALVNVFIDVNGPQGPNQRGRDTFSFIVLNKKFVPNGLPEAENGETSFDNTCNRSGSGYGCGAWVVYKGNMDYLHCDDLKWHGKQKCGK